MLALFIMAKMQIILNVKNDIKKGASRWCSGYQEGSEVELGG